MPRLSIAPAGDANFSLSAQATDAAGNVSAAAGEAVTVNPLPPTVIPVGVTGLVGQALVLQLGIAANGLAGDSNSLASVRIGGIPNGATLSNTNGDVLTVTGGGITFSASQVAAGVLNGLAITPVQRRQFFAERRRHRAGRGGQSQQHRRRHGSTDRHGRAAHGDLVARC